MKAFYFSTPNHRLKYGDGRVITPGETHTVKGTPECCNHGLHGSVRLLDALSYAPGPILWLVELSGEMDHRGDKVAATSRTYIDVYDCTELLLVFARKQASINIELIKPYCTNEYYESVLIFLDTGDLTAARATTKGLTRSVSSELRFTTRPVPTVAVSLRALAAVDVAADAARAACSAADAARAACSAARAAADAAEDESRAASANTMLTYMVRDATGWDI